MDDLCEHETFRSICGICHRDNIIARLTTENERLQRVVEQAIDCGEHCIVEITDNNWRTLCSSPERIGRDVIVVRTHIMGSDQDYPDLYAHLKREADDSDE